MHTETQIPILPSNATGVACGDLVLDCDFCGRLSEAVVTHQGTDKRWNACITCIDMRRMRRRSTPYTVDVRRSPVETTTGMIRVKVDVQQESDDYWVARVQGSAPKSYAGRTRKEAIRLALKGASIPPKQGDHGRIASRVSVC
jgi:hypothetical protein